MSKLSDKERKDYLRLKDKQEQLLPLRTSELTRWNEYRTRMKPVPDPDPNIETLMGGREVTDPDADFPDFEYKISDPEVRKSLYASSKTAIQTEEHFNKSCPACHGQDVEEVIGAEHEDGNLVECLTCGCFFSV